MDQAKKLNQMSNQGQKALANQVNHLRNQYAQMNVRNNRLTNEIRLLQSNQFSMLSPSFFRAMWQWFKKWRHFRSTKMVMFNGHSWPKGCRLTSNESGDLFIAPPGTPEEEIVVTL